MGRQPKERPLLDKARDFTKWHLGRDCFAPFTGSDFPAWSAFVHLVELWTREGGVHAVNAMAATVRCAQPTEAVLRVFVQAIPCVGDWPHVRGLWPQVAAGVVLRDVKPTVLTTSISSDDARVLAAIERCAEYDKDTHKVIGTRAIYRHGWTP